MEKGGEYRCDRTRLPVIAAVARLLCRELTLQNEYLQLKTGRSNPRSGPTALHR